MESYMVEIILAWFIFLWIIVQNVECLHPTETLPYTQILRIY